MQKHVKQIPVYLLALVFIAFGLMYFLKMMPVQPEMNDLQKGYFTALGSTGYMDFIKALEVIGGILLILPRTRGIGICIIVPIVVNILCYEVFIEKAPGIGIALIVLSALAIFFNKEKFAGILGKV
jgi:putative oxidoreductase